MSVHNDTRKEEKEMFLQEDSAVRRNIGDCRDGRDLIRDVVLFRYHRMISTKRCHDPGP
jgi:hypothetical protein